MSYIGNTVQTQGFVPAIDTFSGNGSTTAFTLSRPVASVAQVECTISNVPQDPNAAYTVSGNTITFTSAPPSGTNNIYVRYTSLITQTIAPSQGTVGTAQLGTITNIASGNSPLTLQTGSTPTTAITVDTAQNVGIGISSPASYGKLTVWGGNAFIQSTTASVGAKITLSDTNNSAYVSSAPSGVVTGLAFGIASTEAMRIDSSGNLLVGNTTAPNPASKAYIFNAGGSSQNCLFLQNNANFSGVQGAYIYNANVFNDTGHQFLYCTDGTLRAEIRSNGGIANYSGNNVNLSDERTKTDIQNSNNYLDKICSIPVRTFKYKDQKDDVLNLGVIAQEVEKVAPELVDDSGFGDMPEDGIPLKAIYQTDLTFALMKAIQELNAKVETQAATITALQAKVGL
jgi:hypothetical protein